ncbi:CU044_5270 family protein [Streptomyces sp. NPDC005141]
MDDLTPVRDLAADPAAPTDRARATARARLQNAIGEETRGGRSALARHRPLSRRLVFRAAIAATGAAAVAGTTFAAVRGGGGTGGAGAPRLTTLSAAQVLRRAAERSRSDSADLPVPRNDQYLYAKEVSHRTWRKDGKVERLIDEYWLSVDGSKSSRYSYNGRIHVIPPLTRHQTQVPPVQYAKLKRWPTDPDELLKWFRQGRKGAPGIEEDRIAYTVACSLLRGPRVMPPGLQAAAFEAVAKLPAVVIDHDEVDALGRHGIEISYPGLSFSFVFDPDTYAYLGMLQYGETSSGRRYWQVKGLVKEAVVDRPGERPAR